MKNELKLKSNSLKRNFNYNKKTEIFKFEGKDIAFEIEKSDVMINATQMAKAFGKLPGHFLENQQTWEFINALKSKYGISDNAVLQTVRGGLRVQGTWMHQKLAMKFAAWLSPEFELWIYDRIEELLRNGTTSFYVPKTQAEALRLAAEQAELIEQQQEQLKLQQPKVLFANAVATSSTTILIGELAKIIKQNGIDIGQNRLFDWLRDNGYLIKRKGTDYNMPTQRSMELALFEIKETVINHPDGHVSINKTPKVTGAGQEYFINKFLSNHAA